MTGASPTPQLFDFAKTDRRPSHGHSGPHHGKGTSVIPASLPVNGTLHSKAQHIHPPPLPDIELDMEFDGDGEYDEDSGRSGSAELDMDMDET